MEALLSMKNIKKSFSGVAALKNAELDLYKGEVVALMGENGAGKSTLMKILTGIYSKDEGTIHFEGKEVEYKNVSESEAAGIAIVHQELNMMNDLTVAQNLFIGQERMNGFFIDDKKMEKDAEELFKKLNVDIKPGAKIGELTVGKQQMVEIAKAISTNAKVIVFDEPTAALSNSEIEELFKVIRDLREKGAGIIYISHRMDEINVISDRVTVMRDGEYVGTLITKDCTKDDIIKLMVGRTVFMEPKTQSAVPKDAEVVLKCENLSRGKAVKDVSFELKKGEILGFSGLMGAGRTEVARLLFGADKRDSGKIYVHGKEVDIQSTEDAVKAGIGYLSEDRKRYGLLVDKSVEENTCLASLEKLDKGLFIDEKKCKEISEKYVEELKTKTPGVSQIIKKLSGGNQQAVVIAALIVICVVFSLLTDKFLQGTTFTNISKSAYYVAFMAIGVTFVISTGGIDLSIGTVAICCALIGGTLMEGGLAMPLVLLVILLCGSLFGLINGILVSRLELPAFIATLGTMMVSRGLGSIVSKTKTISFPQGTAEGAWFREIFMVTKEGGLFPKNFPTGFLLLAICAAVMAVVLNKTKTGRYILSIGSNKEATRLSGINVKKYETLAYVFSGFFAALAGIAYVAVFSTAQPNTGNGFELDAIAGVVIGGTSLSGGVGSILGTIIGVFIMTVLKIGFPYIGVQSHYQLFITGIILVFAVYMDILNRKRKV